MLLFNVKREKYLEGQVVFLELHYKMIYTQWYSVKSATKNTSTATESLGFRTVVDIL